MQKKEIPLRTKEEVMGLLKENFLKFHPYKLILINDVNGQSIAPNNNDEFSYFPDKLNLTWAIKGHGGELKLSFWIKYPTGLTIHPRIFS